MKCNWQSVINDTFCTNCNTIENVNHELSDSRELFALLLKRNEMNNMVALYSDLETFFFCLNINGTQRMRYGTIWHWLFIHVLLCFFVVVILYSVIFSPSNCSLICVWKDAPLHSDFTLQQLLCHKFAKQFWTLYSDLLVSTIFFLLNKIFCIRMNTEQVFADRRLLRKCPDWRFSFRLNVSCKFKPVPKRFVAVTLVMFVVFYGQVCLSALSALQCDGVGEEKSTDFPVKSMN